MFVGVWNIFARFCMFFTKKSLATLAENPVLKENLITEDRFSN
jgi:hypothetical protein